MLTHLSVPEIRKHINGTIKFSTGYTGYTGMKVNTGFIFIHSFFYLNITLRTTFHAT